MRTAGKREIAEEVITAALVALITGLIEYGFERLSAHNAEKRKAAKKARKVSSQEEEPV